MGTNDLADGSSPVKRVALPVDEGREAIGMDTPSSSSSGSSKSQPAGQPQAEARSAKSKSSNRAARGAAATSPSNLESTQTDDRREQSPRVQGPDRRATVVDRRSGLERRQLSTEASGYDGDERRSGRERREDTGLERRRGPGRRRSDDRKAAEEGEMTAEQFEFVMAIQTYKKVNKRMYPTWTEVLEVVRQLGYRKVEHRDIKLENVPEPELMKAKVA
ncbi:MAG: hypothetical protein H7Z14_03330 [Anaerolineae bacterium]|nr:hypothetical protein [Phycisphaerae bacterium]